VVQPTCYIRCWECCIVPRSKASSTLLWPALSMCTLPYPLTPSLTIPNPNPSSEVNVEKQKLTLLVPCPGPLPSKFLLVGALKWLE
jgi:hypothetical protein